MIYEKHLHRDDVPLRFLIWLDETANGAPIVRISRSDALADPLSDIVIIGNHPVEIAISPGPGSTTRVAITRMQQVKIPATE